MQEQKRIYSRRFFLVLFGVSLLNLALFFMEQERSFDQQSAKYEKYGKTSLMATYRQVDQVILELQGKDGEEREALLSARRTEASERSDAGEVSGELAAMFLTNRIVQEENKSVSSFSERVEQVLLQATEYQKKGVYSDPETFGYHNVAKTKYDYKKFRNLPVRLSNGKAVQAVMEYRYGDYLLLVPLVFLVLLLTEDKRNGLNQIVYGTPGGRDRLAWKRCLALLLGSVLSTMVLCGTMIVEALLLYRGWSSLGDLLQCHAYFEGTLFLLSKAEFLLVYLLVHSLSAFAFCLLLWMLFSLCKGRNSALFLFGVLTAAEYLCIVLIQSNSRLGLLTVCNMFSLVEPSRCMVGYFNFPFLGIAVDKGQLLLGMLPVVILLTGGVAVCSEAWQRPSAREGLLDRMLGHVMQLLRRLTSGFSVFVMELYKLLVLRKGILVLAFLLLLCVGQRDIAGLADSRLDALYRQYLESIDRQTGEGAAEYLESVEWEILNTKNSIADAEKKGEETFALKHVLEQKEALRAKILSGLERKETIFATRGISVFLLQDVDYDAVFGGRCRSYQERYAIFAVVALLVLQSGIYSFERQQKTEQLIAGTPGGRKRLFLKKLGVSVILTGIVFVITYLPQLKSLREAFRLEDWEAPIQSLESFTDFPLRISIRTWMLGIYGYRFLLLTAVMLFATLISLCTTEQTSLMFSMVLFLPHFLSMLGIAIPAALSVVQQIAYNACFLQYGYGIRSFLGGGCWLIAGACAGIAAGRLTAERGRKRKPIRPDKEGAKE